MYLTSLTAAIVDPDETGTTLPSLTVCATPDGPSRQSQVTCYPYDIDAIVTALGNPSDIRYGDPCGLVFIDYHYDSDECATELMARLRASLSGIYTYAWTKLHYAGPDGSHDKAPTLVCYPEGTAVGIVVPAEAHDAHAQLVTSLWRMRLVEQSPLHYRWSPEGELELVVWLTQNAHKELLFSCQMVAERVFA